MVAVWRVNVPLVPSQFPTPFPKIVSQVSFMYPFRKSQVSEGEGESVQFTDEDWERLNKVIGYKEGDEQSIINNAKPDALHTFLEVQMRHSASKLYDGEKECLAELSCEGLNCSVKLFPETKIADIKLGRYRLSSPSGLLAEVFLRGIRFVLLDIKHYLWYLKLLKMSRYMQSAPASHSVLAVFCYKPFDAKVDWSLVAKASPCYMTVRYLSLRQICFSSYLKKKKYVADCVAICSI